MSMCMESMEWGRELEGGAVGVVVDVGVGDLTEVVPVTRAGLLAPGHQQPRRSPRSSRLTTTPNPTFALVRTSSSSTRPARSRGGGAAGSTLSHTPPLGHPSETRSVSLRPPKEYPVGRNVNDRSGRAPFQNPRAVKVACRSPTLTTWSLSRPAPASAQRFRNTGRCCDGQCEPTLSRSVDRSTRGTRCGTSDRCCRAAPPRSSRCARGGRAIVVSLAPPACAHPRAGRC